MGEEEGEEAVLEDMEALVSTSTKGIDALEFRVMLGGPQDGCNAYLQISAGAGGVDSCDWAGMLLRMFTRWAESKGHEANLIDRVEETEGGIRSATLYVKGSFAFGYLKAELGVHRLVRISPFDSQARRHTAFASVDVSPEVEDDLDVGTPFNLGFHQWGCLSFPHLDDRFINFVHRWRKPVLGFACRRCPAFHWNRLCSDIN